AVCTAPYADCNRLASDGCETNTSTDVNNCGGCGNFCSFPNGLAACIGGRCQLAGCLSGFADCDGLPGSGCEVNLQTDPNHCGSCTNSCGTGQVCSAGFCCPNGQTNCSGTCVDLTSDRTHCGGCSTVCSSSQICSSGTCTACHYGQTVCGGTCVDLNRDANHCGA